MHNPESALGNVTNKIPGDSEIQMSPNLGQKTRPSESQQKKKKNEKNNLRNSALCRTGRLQSKI